jgi:hypothetical protein
MYQYIRGKFSPKRKKSPRKQTKTDHFVGSKPHNLSASS